VIHDLTPTIIGPQRLAITGPNGSDRTTLPEMINGQLNSDICRALNPDAPQ
jgi:ABC-type Mn2+/Zn2+ transport system ATPase subunit